jgi:lactoylglutathione lyase
MANSIGNVAVYVGDLERAERFYVDALGLVVRTRIDAPTVAEVIVGGADGDGSSLMLAMHKSGSAPPKPAGIWKVFVFCDDIEATLAAAVAAGAAVVLRPMRLPEHRITIAMINDLDGYLVELGQRH